MPSDLSRPRTLYLLNQASKGLKKRLERALAEQNITTLQYTVLSIVRDRDGLSSSDLSRRFFVTPQTMNQVVADLEKAGFLRRSEDQNNRRILRIVLTPRGRAIVQVCESIVDRIEEDAFGAIPVTHHQNLRKVLRSLLDRARASTDDKS